MKLLFDQNVSFRVVRSIEYLFPDSMQVKQAGLVDKSDIEIWQFAREKDLILVTFDSDFSDLSNIKGFPPKIIWLRFLDQRTSQVIKKITEKQMEIKAFGNDPEFGVLEII